MSRSMVECSGEHPVTLKVRLIREIERLAPSRATVLLRGGSAAGRARVARVLHDRSNRGAEPFLELDCGALETEKLEGLFGGPVSQRAPRPVPTGRGTLYLAGVEGLPILFQPRLMGFLDGGERPRVVVSTGADLALAADRGRLRKDLAERLQLVQLALPDE